MILLIDNYDSFVFNLARYCEELGQSVRVRRNDALTVEAVAASPPAAIILSPGPCDPERAGISVPLVRALSGAVPILGVCLGHQAIAAAFGARIERAARPRHGEAFPIEHCGSGIFRGLPSPFPAARYHSLVVAPDSVPPCLEVIATTFDSAPVIMALRHRSDVTIGVQFHPESVLTSHGHALLEGFFDLAGLARGRRNEREAAPFAAPGIA